MYFLPSVVYVMYFGHSDEKLSTTENWSHRSGVVGLTKPDHVVLSPSELVYQRNLEEFRDGARML
jgi:hypothetical protein